MKNSWFPQKYQCTTDNNMFLECQISI